MFTLSHNIFVPYHHGNLRNALLEAALESVETSSAEALSLRKISEKVGVTPNAVYRHFANREELLVAVSDYGFERLAQAFESTPTRNLDTIGQAYVEFGLTHPNLYRLMFSGRRVSTPREEDRSFQIVFEAMRSQLGDASSDEIVLQEAINAWAYVHGMVMLLLDQVVKIEEISFRF